MANLHRVAVVAVQQFKYFQASIILFSQAVVSVFSVCMHILFIMFLML